MASAISAPFTVGKRELYLPRFSLILLRTPQIPPSHARFQVPLWFSKLDLRDYLYHAYSVRTHSITTYIRQQRARFGSANPKTPLNRKWHRPRAKKFMTVQLEEPFVWPEEPKGDELAKWSVDELEAQAEAEESAKEERSATKDTIVNKERRERMREQAKALLEGRQKWKPRTSRSLGQMLTR